MRAPNKLWKAALAAAFAAVLVTSACGSNSSSGGGSGDGTKNADGSVTLTWTMWASGTADAQIWQNIAKSVTDKYPNIHINLQTTAISDYYTKLGTRMAAGTAPCLVSSQSSRIAGYTQGMLPLDDMIKQNNYDVADFDKTILKGLSGTDGKQYAIPYDFGPQILWYNRDLFQQEGVPEPKVGWTVNDFLTTARALTKDGKYAIALYPTDALTMIFSMNGGQPVNDAGKLQLTDPRMVQGYQTFAGMVTKDKISPALPGVDSNWSKNQFYTGNVALMSGGPWSISDIKAKSKFTFAPVTMPAAPNGMQTSTQGSGFGISKTCKDPEDAFKALTVITSKETLSSLGQQGRAFPARKSAQNTWYDQAKMPGAKEVLDAGIAASQAQRYTKNWDQVSKLIEQFGVAAFNGQSPVADFLQQVQSQASQN